ncbi:MAG: hypothetical protein KGS45_13480 [Planctomycetes bacterium]|nr:hypothetical protein [Planctomycetota bacterium]
MPRVRNSLLLATLLLTSAVPALHSTAHAQIPTFDNGPPLLSPGTDRSLAQLISSLETSLKDTPKPAGGSWAKLSKSDRASLVLRRNALSLATRADELGVKGHQHALAARIVADVANTSELTSLLTRIDESLIDHASTEVQSAWPDDATPLATELRRRLGVFITGDESTLTWTGHAIAPATTPTGVEALDRAVRDIESAFAPTLPLAAFAPARNHTRSLLTRACQHARDDSGLSGSALTIFHARFTAILNALKQDPFDPINAADLDTLVQSADLIAAIFPSAGPSAKSQPKPATDPLSSLSAAEREAITRFALSSGPSSMNSDRIDTAHTWFATMSKLASTAGKPRTTPPPLKQLDKVITSRAVAAAKDASKSFADLFRTQVSPRDPAVLAGLTALRKAQSDFDSIEHLRATFSTKDQWNDQSPLAATRFTKLGVEFQNTAKRDAALATLRSWASGFDTDELSPAPPPTDPSCATTLQRLTTLFASLQDRKKGLLNHKADPSASTLASLDQQFADLRALALDLSQTSRFIDLPLAASPRHLIFARVPGLHLTEPTFNELLVRARGTLTTADALLDQWAKGAVPTRQHIQSLRDELSISAAIGRALPTLPGSVPPHPLQSILCGTPPTALAARADALAALCRAVEAHIAAIKSKDANAMPMLTFARSCAARIDR